eukprot:m.8408 g.8408  ORF g.8408 m.8408 type:complete len:218 (-) comp2532_c0_seq2:794-1447(-)
MSAAKEDTRGAIDAASRSVVGQPTEDTETGNAHRAREECRKYCAMFPDVTPIGRNEIEARRDHYVLIDCRTSAETSVSVIEGALLQRQFEALDLSSAPELAGKTLVPYCTIGYRSGTYARKLQKQLHDRSVDTIDVRNGEGVLLWIHDGGMLVSPPPPSPRANDVHSEPPPPPTPVRRVHTYGPPWDFAPPDYDTVTFGTLGMMWHGLMFKWADRWS